MLRICLGSINKTFKNDKLILHDFIEFIPSLRCLWRWGTILNAEDEDGDTHGGVVHIKGDVVLAGNIVPVCNLRLDSVDSSVADVSVIFRWVSFDVGRTNLFPVVVEDADIRVGFGIGDNELKSFDESQLRLHSLSWFVSVVIFNARYYLYRILLIIQFQLNSNYLNILHLLQLIKFPHVIAIYVLSVFKILSLTINSLKQFSSTISSNITFKSTTLIIRIYKDINILSYYVLMQTSITACN